ncbi:MAG: arsenate reductase family protein [Pararhodobacter sp.]
MSDPTPQIWGLKTCDTCRKALKALPDAAFRDIRAEPLTGEEIANLLTTFGDSALNRASTTWRGLSEAERATPPAELLAAHPALMKRPVIKAGADWHLGWTPATRKALGVV